MTDLEAGTLRMQEAVVRWFLMEAVALALTGPGDTRRIADWARRPEHEMDLASVVAGLAQLVAAQLPQDGAAQWVADMPRVREEAQGAVDEQAARLGEVLALRDLFADPGTSTG